MPVIWQPDCMLPGAGHLPFVWASYRPKPGIRLPRLPADIARLQGLGGAAAQLGTPFAVTIEGDAHPEFKRVLAQAREEEMVEFNSLAGLPARAVGTPWLRAYLRSEGRLQTACHARSRCTKNFDCLAQCRQRDGLPGWGQFCIDNQLAAAPRGDVKKGLF